MSVSTLVIDGDDGGGAVNGGRLESGNGGSGYSSSKISEYLIQYSINFMDNCKSIYCAYDGLFAR